MSCLTTGKQQKIPALQYPVPNDAEIQAFYRRIEQESAKPIILSIVPGFATLFRHKALDVSLPKPISSYFNKDLVGLTLEEIQEHCEEIFNSIVSISESQSEAIEQLTRGQSKSVLWKEFRAGRPSGSNAGPVFRTNIQEPSLWLLNNICYPSKSSFTGNDATRYPNLYVQFYKNYVSFIADRWGSKMEKKAMKILEKEIIDQGTHTDFSMQHDCGVIIKPGEGYVCGSPDGRVSCRCHGQLGLVEMKCPHKHRDVCVKVAAKASDFPLSNDDKNGTFTLKTNHDYYYQVQMQMYVACASFCIFCVYTNVSIAYTTVLPDVSLMEQMSVKAKLYFREVVLPQVVANYFTTSAQIPVEGNNMNPCLCGEVRDEDAYPVVICANNDCLVKTFHKACTKTKIFRKGWMCAHCRSLNTKEKAKARRDEMKENQEPKTGENPNKKARVPLGDVN